MMVAALTALNYRTKYKNKTYEQMPYEIVIANVGSSHGQYGFLYEQTDELNTFNFAMSSQELKYDYNLFDYYADHFRKKSVLFIPISYFSFHDINDPNIVGEDYYRRYYNLLDRKRIPYENIAEYINIKYFFSLKETDKQTKSVFKTKATAQPQPQVMPLYDRGVARADFHMDLVMNPDRTQIKEQSKIAKKSLENLIVACRKHEVTPILLTTPYTHYYTDHFPDLFLDFFSKQIDSVVSKYEVEYLDFSLDERFSDFPQLFQDTDHLNQAGAKLFTEIMIDYVRQKGYIDLAE